MAGVDAGRRLFAREGCGSCHRLQAAGTNGELGPDLDRCLPGHTRASLVAKIVDPEPNVSPGVFNVMPTDYGRRLDAAELDALVAFLLPRRLLAGTPGGAANRACVTQVIAFANQKGGVAKTTSTLNLGAALAEAGHRVLCVDMDPQSNLTMSQGVDPEALEHSMYDVLVRKLPIREVIVSREVDVACASIDLAGAEIALSTMIGRERALERALTAVQPDYDFVCIDTPPSLGLLTINALTAAHKVIVPVQCEYLSMRGLAQLQNTLAMIRENLNPDVAIEGILPTLVDLRTLHAQEALELLEESFGDRVFASRIKKTVRFAEAPVQGMSVLRYDPTGTAADSYRQLAKEVLSNGNR